MTKMKNKINSVKHRIHIKCEFYVLNCPELLTELSDIGTLPLVLNNQRINMKVKIKRNQSGLKKHINRNTARMYKYDKIHIEIDLNSKPHNVEIIDGKMKVSDDYYIESEFKIKVSLTVYVILKELKIAISNFLLAILITCPYALVSESVSCNFNDKQIFLNTDFKYSVFDITIENWQNSKWPKFTKISFTETWLWMSKYKDVFNGYSNSQVGRVINSLKYIASSNDDDYGYVANWIWSLLALEALFNDNKLSNELGTGRQIENKIVSLHKKCISGFKGFETINLDGLYNKRSGFLHGQVNFPAPNFPWDGMQEYEKHLFSSWDMTNMIISIILATIQYMIKNNLTNLEFTHSYKVISKNTIEISK